MIGFTTESGVVRCVSQKIAFESIQVFADQSDVVLLSVIRGFRQDLKASLPLTRGRT